MLFSFIKKCYDVSKIQSISSSLRFPKFEFVSSQGSAGEFLLLWHDNLNIQVIMSNDNMVNCMVFGPVATYLCVWTARTVFEACLLEKLKYGWSGFRRTMVHCR